MNQWPAVIASAAALSCAGAAAPPAAPTHLHGVRLLGGGSFSWDPVPGATGYAVHVSYGFSQTFCGKEDICPPFHADYPLDANATAVVISWPSYLTDVAMSVHATSASGAGKQSEALSFANPPIILQETVSIGAVELRWTGLDLRAVSITRSANGGEQARVASNLTSGSWTDFAVDPDTAYAYTVIADTVDPRLQTMAFTQVHTRLAAPALALDCAMHQLVAISPVADAASYQLGTASSPGGPYAWSAVSTQADPGCGSACYVVARAIDGAGNPGAQSAEISIDAPPGWVTGLVEGNRVGAVHLSWTPTPGAGSYDIYRGDPPSSPGSTSFLATVSGPSFDDASAAPFQQYAYDVYAVSPDRCARSRESSRAVGFATTAPDQMNLATPVGEATATVARQTFAIGQPGQLMGIELAARPAANGRTAALAIRNGAFVVARPSATWVTPDPQAVPLVADQVRAVYYDFSQAGLMVSAGEQLSIEWTSGGASLVTDDAYLPGSYAPYGLTDSTHDLQFKTFVRPASTATLELRAQGGDRSIALGWTAIAGAASYEIFEQGSSLGMTSDTSTLFTGLGRSSTHTYFIRAHLGGGGAVDSAPVTASTLAMVVDQANLGMVVGVGLVLNMTGPLAQSFTSGIAGTLAGIEVSTTLLPSPFERYELLDGAGTVLGSGTLSPRSAAVAADLFPFVYPVISSAFIDFSASGIALVPGLPLSLRLATTNLYFLDTPDAYGDGAEAISSVQTSRDLVFRTWVVPAN